MASINFEKATGKEYLSAKQIEEVVSKHRDKKQAKQLKLQREIAARSYNPNSQWILPSVQKMLTENSRIINKRAKNHSDSSESSDNLSEEPKKEKNRKDKGRYRRKSSSSSSSSQSEDNYKKTSRKSKKKKRRRSSSSSDSDTSEESATKTTHTQERDDWMNLESIIPTYSKKEKTKDDKKETSITAGPGQTNRELNPYWKDGGSGVPLTDKKYDMSTSVGDKGLEWYERALKRAQETAIEQGRTVADVVSERWGSLQNLTDLITNAQKEKMSSTKSRLPFQKPGSEFGRILYTGFEDKKGNWAKHSDKSKEKSRSRSSKEKGNLKDNKSDRRKDKSRSGKTDNDFHHKGCGNKQINEPKGTLNLINNADVSLKVPNEQSAKILNDDDLNKLAAKLVKAEMLGKTEQVLKLKIELDASRAARQRAIEAVGSVKATTSDEVVVLVMSSNTGLARPYHRPALVEPSKGRRKKKNAETHRDGERVRYFPDDDHRNLKQMFETEKFGTHDDDKAMFLKLATKHAGADVEEDDAAFADVARVTESAGKQQQRDLHQAVKETQQRHRQLENCRFCFNSPKMCKNLIVSLGKKSYLCLPVVPLTPLHCVVVPLDHSISGTHLDEDVWEEMHNFRLAIMAMAKALNQYAIFFEDARGFKKFPHMTLQCVLLNKFDGEQAPIYFKKALLDCEEEWTTNKKVVDIKGRDIRGTIPKGLPYFSVEFPPDKGFAHVIENEDRFPSNFAQSVIGGMLDMDHRFWRKPSKNNDSAMAQRERTIEFSRKYLKYDFITKTKLSRSSSSSSTSSDSE